MRFVGKVHWVLLGVALLVLPRIVSGYDISADSIRRHISILAADSLEGREVGEPGEVRAARYITDVLQRAGLPPAGDDSGYLQPFEFIKKIDEGANNTLSVNGVTLELGSEWQPLKQSGSMSFRFDKAIDLNYGITAEGSDYDDYRNQEVKGKAVVIKRFAPSEEEYPHIDFNTYSSLTDKIMRALDHKVAAIFFYTPADHDDTMLASVGVRSTPKGIPIIWIRRAGMKRLGLSLDQPDINSASGQTDLVAVRDTGYNVIAALPSANDTTVIIGAHYDHLGWGGPTSRYRGKEKKIHHGADDNASGTAALLELARYYSDSPEKLEYSYVFVAFSGEEKGLLGSSYLAHHLPVDSGKIRMMVNMDMIGRLKDQEKGLAIFGTGTCPEFKSFFDSLQVNDLTLTVKESGTGPSDHTAFYNLGIPVLHFFTGAHEDYHTPGDVIGKVDFDGIVRVAALVEDIVEAFDKFPGPLHFRRTRDENAGKRRAAYSVTLGVMPDYIATVKGLKIDGVSEGGAADRAGIKKGDIVIRMGSYTVDDIYAYMNALSKFHKGDSTQVTVARGADTLSLDVVF